MELLGFNGYQGSVETALADGVVHGKILFIADLVSYEAQTLPELRQAFEEAVVDYVATCKSIGKIQINQPVGT